ncbi:MAG TPA: HD domain-containing protein [Solirubrobacteraceae bacterium]|nr:HD domain-containing protein [Solirubrobacteraceae bacterium]
MPEQPFVPSFVVGLPLARDALAFADELHRGQRRSSDEAPFILHPLEVAALLQITGHSEAAVAAGILHDTVEDTPVEIGAIEQRFGGRVAALVAAMTEDPRIDAYQERKAALRRQIAAFGEEATAIYAADKVAKVRELRAQAGRDPDLLGGQDEDVRRRLEHYVESLAMLEEETASHPLVQQLRFELEALRALPPRASSPV